MRNVRAIPFRILPVRKRRLECRHQGAPILATASRPPGLSRRAGLPKTSITTDDGSPFDYVWHTWDFFLNTNSQVSDFNNPNERVWLFRYDYDFAALGIPGLALIARYVRGTGIDGREVGPAYAAYQKVRDGRHWERNFWLSYVVQSGPARDLSFRLLQATHRVNGDHTAEVDIDELRLILEFPLDLRMF